jgi:hypothetical protein
MTLTGSFLEQGGGPVSLGTNITVSDSNSIHFEDPITLSAAAILTTGGGVGADIVLHNTIDGAFGFTLDGGTGGNVFFDAAGSIAPLASLSATGGIVSQNSTAHTIGTILYTAVNRINLADNATTNGNSFTAAGQTIISAAVTVDTTNSGGFPGAPISFLSINGAFPLTLTAGTASVSYGPIGATFPPTSFTVTGSTINQNSSVKTVGAISYTGTINIDGDLITSGASITFTGPVMLNATSVMDTTNNGSSLAGSPIFFSSTLNGSQSLTLTSGTTGSITFSGTVGSIPLGIVTINTSNGVTASNAFSALALIESAATGINNFSTLATTASTGIILKGSTLNLTGPITTSGGGGLNITNTGLLTLSSPISLNGLFTQTGGGSVSLGANITTTGNSPISFTSSVLLTGAGPITLTTFNRNVFFADTLNGAVDCIINIGKGFTFFDQPVGNITPLSSLTITGGTVFQNNSVQITGALNYSADAFIGGNITTNLNPISITGNVTQINTPITLSTGGGAGTITITGSIDGDIGGRNLILNSSTATTILNGITGANIPFNNLTINASQITINGIGGSLPGVSGTTTLTAASGPINFPGALYSANNATYTSPTTFSLTHPGDTSFNTTSGNIQFTTGQIILSNGSNFIASTNNGNLSFPSLIGTTSHDIQISLGSGIATLGTIGTLTDIHSVVVAAGAISLSGPITSSTLNLQAIGNILNTAAPVKLTSIGFIQINSLTGTLGTLASPLDVDPPLVIGGAGGAAYFIGSTGDGTIHCYPGNGPSPIIFNGSIITCGGFPIPPTPSAVSIAAQRIRLFYVPGIYSPDYNLSSDFYYLKDFVTESDVQSLFMPLYGIRDTIPQHKPIKNQRGWLFRLFPFAQK